MKSVGMVFNAEMVKALLSGNQTVTRRPVNIPDGWAFDKVGKITSPHPKKGTWGAFIRKGVGTQFPETDLVKAPCWIGDEIYVRETWGVVSHDYDENDNIVEWSPDRPSMIIKDMKFGQGYYSGNIIYRSDGEFSWSDDYGDEISAWKSSTNMSKEISRITLKVTDVRIERVQDITEEQAISEGMPTNKECQKIAIDSGLGWHQKPVTWFKSFWNGLYNNWDDNPHVWVIEFEVIKSTIVRELHEIK
ncbi:hypothetical protein [Aliivibrio fischeri]|uniref:hypothetical protein n=1 Tax=Aliivibrio fischeri TaxID=668 RepID=UPI0007C53FF0|nr:hypothetical protein [Aliivibrio fischeri]